MKTWINETSESGEKADRSDVPEQLNPEEETTVTPQNEREDLRMSRHHKRRSRMEGGGLEAR